MIIYNIWTSLCLLNNFFLFFSFYLKKFLNNLIFDVGFFKFINLYLKFSKYIIIYYYKAILMYKDISLAFH